MSYSTMSHSEAVRRRTLLAGTHAKCVYAYRGLIPKAWILEEWGRTLAHAKPAILHFADNRKTASGIWPHLRRLVHNADVWAAQDRQRKSEKA